MTSELLSVRGVSGHVVKRLVSCHHPGSGR